MVRCRDCGFFSLRDRVTGNPVWADDLVRLGHRLPEHHDGAPICYALEEDFPGTLGLEPSDEAIFEEMLRERECDGFYQWRPGTHPIEHHNMQYRERREARDVERERTQREWQRNLQDNVEARQRAWQERLEKDLVDLTAEREDRRHRSEMWILAIVGLLGSAVGAASSIIAGLVGRGSLF